MIFSHFGEIGVSLDVYIWLRDVEDLWRIIYDVLLSTFLVRNLILFLIQRRSERIFT